MLSFLHEMIVSLVLAATAECSMKSNEHSLYHQSALHLDGRQSYNTGNKKQVCESLSQQTRV